jgi:subtilisin family serine protease
MSVLQNDLSSVLPELSSFQQRSLGDPAKFSRSPMEPADVVKLTPLMRRTSGRSDIAIGLIDGPVLLSHRDLASQNIREVPGGRRGICASADSAACLHGTFVAGVLFARRGSAAPAICPGCTLLVRPIFPEGSRTNGDMPTATPQELAEAIVHCVDAGARVINLSTALAHPSSKDDRDLEQSLDYAGSHGVVSVAAAGNQGELGSSTIIRHPSVIPVAACDLQGKPLTESNLGRSIGRRGLMAPGKGITSLGTDGEPQTSGGTSAAAPFVTGAIALLWSEFPQASANHVQLVVTRSGEGHRRSIAPPLLDAFAAYQAMSLNLNLRQ